MKKLLILFVAVGSILVSGCQGDDGRDGVTVEARTFELLNVNFGLNNNGEYTIYRTINPTILDSDSILIYRLAGTIDSQTPIWQLIPRTLFLDEGELDYDYDFSLEDFTIYAGGTYNLAQTPQFLNNQTFRIVAIPGYFSTSKGTNSPTVDLSDYNAVVKAYGLENQPIIQL